MNTYIYIILFLSSLLAAWYIFFAVLSYRIYLFEQKMIQIFSSRTDSITGLYESTKGEVEKHSEIFSEILSLRKKEFSLVSISHTLESFINLEKRIHHEINFIFQVCNKNPKLARKKEFLYMRDIMMEKSMKIWEYMKKYKKIIEIYNKFVRIKNYSLIGIVLPFSKKEVL